MGPITPYLWFDGNAEEAVDFYLEIFPASRRGEITRYDEAVAAVTGMDAGSVMTINFELNDQPFTALNGGPMYAFTPAISFLLPCGNAQETDRVWKALTDGGEEQPCGWCRDRFGVSWQVVPDELFAMLSDPDEERRSRVTQALFPMTRIDIAALRDAYDGH